MIDDSQVSATGVGSASVVPRLSVSRFAVRFGAATALGQLAQVVWLVLGSRTMSPETFGSVLAAQVLYGVLQIVVDNGAAWHGARLAAAGTLNDAARASLVRVRLQLWVPAALVGLAIAAAGGWQLVAPTAPFLVALFLFALLNYWERFGLGDPAPWCGYIILRGVAPAAAAVVFYALGRNFPSPLAGTIECGVILVVAALYRLRPFHLLAAAFRALRGPWRSVAQIGLTSVLGQIMLGFGTILLAATGSPAAAAPLAVGVRLLTGANGISGVVGTALFPHLARGGEDTGGPHDDPRQLARALRAIFSVALAALGVLLIDPALVTRLFLGTSESYAQSTTTITVAATGAAALTLISATVLIARRREDTALRANTYGLVLTIGGAVAVVVADPGEPSTWIAAALLGGLLFTALVIAAKLSMLFPVFAGPARMGTLVATATAVAGLTAALIPELHLVLAAGLLASAAAMLVSVIRPAALADGLARETF